MVPSGRIAEAIRVSQRGGEPVQVVLIGEEGCQVGRQVGMPRQQSRAVRRSARLEIFEVGRDDLVEPLLSIVVGPWSESGGARGDAGHGFASLDRRVGETHQETVEYRWVSPTLQIRTHDSSRVRRVFSPRWRSPATAALVDPSSSAISASGIPRR